MSEPVRVLHVVTTMNRGGLETMLMNYYRFIDRSKVQFDFLVHRNFKMDYESEIKSLGGNIYYITRLIPWSIHYKKSLVNFFLRHKEFIIVHVHQDCLSSIALKCAKRCGVPIRIAHSHNSRQPVNLKYLIKRYYMRYIPKYATSLFACGKEAGKWMFHKNNFIVVRNAIDTYKFSYDVKIRSEMRKSLNIQPHEIVIGHVGRFSQQKNHTFLIRVFQELLKINNHFKLLLIGSGELESSIMEMVRSSGLYNRVTFLGKRSDVNKLMQAMDCFLFPSFFEGLPLVLVEAQAAGLLIIKSSTISDECVITPNVFSISLEKSAQEWAKIVYEKIKLYRRSNTDKYIIYNHYDLSFNARLLQDYYLKEFNRVNYKNK